MGGGDRESLPLGHEVLTDPSSQIYGEVKPAGHQLFMAWIYLSRADSPPLLLKVVKSKHETMKARLLALRVALADALDELRWGKYIGVVVFYVDPDDPQTALELNSLDQGDLPDGRKVPQIAFRQGLWARDAEPTEDVPEPVPPPEEDRRVFLEDAFMDRVAQRKQAEADYVRVGEVRLLEERLGGVRDKIAEFVEVGGRKYMRARLAEQRALNRLMELEGDEG